MNVQNRTTRLGAIAVLSIFLSKDVMSADAYDACKIMMGKLAIQYEMETLKNRVERTPFDQTNIVRKAESVVGNSYGLTKDQLDKKWPRLWRFAVLTFIDGTRSLPRPEEFQERAFLTCVREFG